MLSKRISRSLSLQLFFGVLISLLAAAGMFTAFFSVGGQILNHTIYEPFASKMADRKFEKLQTYVEKEQIAADSLWKLDAWSRRGDKLYLTIYIEDCLEYGEKDSAFDPEKFDPALENPDWEYPLKLSDGTVARAFLYYYAGDIFLFSIAAIAGVLAFLTFSLCFIVFVHRKISYIIRLKQELDILAGGDLNYPVTVRGEDELSQLASGIDQMRRSVLNHQAAEEQMRAANSQLVTAMSHDLRTPLTSLLAYLELMERGKYDSEEQLHHFIDRSLEKTLRIKAMADKLFEYYLVCAAEWEHPVLESVDADETLQQFWSEYAFSLEGCGFRVEQDFQELNGTLEANLEMLRRAFDNLYSNLLKYADRADPIRISFRRQNSEMIFELVNTISPQRNRCESTGIGLNTCRRILLEQNGSFETEEYNQRFRVQLRMPLKRK